MNHRASVAAPASAVLCLAVACWAVACLAAPASAEIAPVTPGTVIEWRDPEVTRAGRPYDWRTHRIVATEGTTVRYVHEGQGGGARRMSSRARPIAAWCRSRCRSSPCAGQCAAEPMSAC
jgi:hypothetical protein